MRCAAFIVALGRTACSPPAQPDLSARGALVANAPVCAGLRAARTKFCAEPAVRSLD